MYVLQSRNLRTSCIDLSGFDRGAGSNVQPTGLQYKAGPRFGEFCSCFCSTLLPQLACSILTTWGPPFTGALYKLIVSALLFPTPACHVRMTDWACAHSSISIITPE